jgi:hypothetical protein
VKNYRQLQPVMSCWPGFACSCISDCSNQTQIPGCQYCPRSPKMTLEVLSSSLLAAEQQRLTPQPPQRTYQLFHTPPVVVVGAHMLRCVSWFVHIRTVTETWNPKHPHIMLTLQAACRCIYAWQLLQLWQQLAMAAVKETIAMMPCYQSYADHGRRCGESCLVTHVNTHRLKTQTCVKWGTHKPRIAHSVFHPLAHYADCM